MQLLRILCCLFLFIVASVLIADKAVCRKDALSISVGGLWDLTGYYRREGQAAYIAARKAVECLNSQGGVGGRPLELVVADTRGEPGRLLLEARKLVEQEKVVALLGPISEALTPVLRNYAETRNVPTVLTSGDDPLLPSKKNESVCWTFSISPSLGPAIKILFREFARAGLGPQATITCAPSSLNRCNCETISVSCSPKVLPSSTTWGAFSASSRDMMSISRSERSTWISFSFPLLRVASINFLFI